MYGSWSNGMLLQGKIFSCISKRTVKDVGGSGLAVENHQPS